MKNRPFKLIGSTKVKNVSRFLLISWGWKLKNVWTLQIGVSMGNFCSYLKCILRENFFLHIVNPPAANESI